MTSEYIVCGKFDNVSDLGPSVTANSSKIRLFAGKIGTKQKTQPTPISAGKSGIWFEGQLWEPSSFLLMASTKGIRCLLVLTNQEYLDIVEQASTFNLYVEVFEKQFPFIPKIKYSYCLRTNYEVLLKQLRSLDRLGIEGGGVSKELANRYWRALTRKIQFKNELDRHFFFAYKEGYQEVFKLKEERSDRVIVALDFNSMYVDSMRGQFCQPSSVIYKDFQGERGIPGNLENGIYRVRLLNPLESYFLDYHPFRYKRLGSSWSFQLHKGNVIETILHKDELKYFSQFFEDVELLEGVVSNKTIKHPLLEKGINLYKERMYHRRRGDKKRENLCKISMQHLHSSSNQKKFAKKFFNDIEEVRNFLATSFRMNLSTLSFDEIVNFLTRQKYFEITPFEKGYLLKYLDIDSTSTVFSLSAQIVANARLKVIQTIERFLGNKSVELCYVNTDSIHLSIHRDELDTFFKTNQDIISDELGALKVEAIADCGYWFDVGRYWLKKEGNVILFKNKGFNSVATRHSFVSRRRIFKFVNTSTFSHLQSQMIKIENSFSYKKRLVHHSSVESCFIRYQYQEIKELHTANLTEANEQLSSKKEKIDLFAKISSEF